MLSTLCGSCGLFYSPMPFPTILRVIALYTKASELTAELSPGQQMKLNDKNYRVTAVGRVATANLRQLGHITLNFDGADIAELPGTVHLYGEPPQIIQPGDQISFYPNCH